MSLIGSLKNKKLKYYQDQDDSDLEDAGLTLNERFTEFLQKNADRLILVYLDKYERDKFAAGTFLSHNSSWRLCVIVC